MVLRQESFLYVDDAADGIISASEKYEKEHPVNLGSGVEISIKDLANLIKLKVKFEGEIKWDNQYPNGQPRRCLDVKRAEEEFGFRATTNLDKGLDKTINWFLENRNSLREIKY